MERTKMITIALIVGGGLLVLGVAALMFYLLISPENAELADVQAKLDEENDIAAQLDQKETELEDITAQWLEAREELQKLRRTRSRPISIGHPAAAMTALWYEYREELPPLIEDWVESTGCTIESGASFPAPAMTPPDPPPSGFLQVPQGQTITLTVSGSLADIERLYHSLHEFERVVTVSQLVLQQSGDRLQTQVPLKFYLIVENPPGVSTGGGGEGGGGEAGPGPGEGEMAPGEEGEDMPADEGEEMMEDEA